LRKTYPFLKWVQSFSDATQSGDGTIYRASGFVLTAITRNKTMLRMPDGSVVAAKALDNPQHTSKDGRYGSAVAKENGAKAMAGFQLRYVYFLDPSWRSRLAVPEIPFSDIARVGAGMYRGKPRAGSADSGTPGLQPVGGGATPTPALSQ
jgi:hypothetical protein